MTLSVTGSEVRGTYESPVSSTGGPVTGALVGFVNGDRISFVVNWPTGSLTAWVGHLAVHDGKETIDTLWQMVRGAADTHDADEAWQATLSGTDVFHR